jgi:hypothetical protein
MKKGGERTIIDTAIAIIVIHVTGFFIVVVKNILIAGVGGHGCEVFLVGMGRG